MSTTWKALIALALVVPLAAYVVGALVPSTADDGRNRPVIIGERPDNEPAPPAPSQNRTPDEKPATKPGRTDDAGDDDRGEDEDDGGDDDSRGGGAAQEGSGQRGDQTDDGRRDDRDAGDRTRDRDDSDDGDDRGDDD